MKSISIPNKVEYIEGYVFSGCSSLTSVTLPTNARDISTNAFSGCGSLTSITIPKIWYLGDKAFSGCSNLTNIVYGGTKADWKSIASDRGKINKKGKVTVKCTDGELKFTFNN